MTDPIITDRDALRVISRPTTEEEVEKLDLVNRLRASNAIAWTNGCGLAAIQIGIPVRFAWFVFERREHTLLNPELSFGIGSILDKEGCLSIPGIQKEKERYYEIEYFTGGKKRSAKGMKARIIQHEIDHMNGILFLDKEGL